MRYLSASRAARAVGQIRTGNLRFNGFQDRFRPLSQSTITCRVAPVTRAHYIVAHTSIKTIRSLLREDPLDRYWRAVMPLSTTVTGGVRCQNTALFGCNWRVSNRLVKLEGRLRVLLP